MQPKLGSAHRACLQWADGEFGDRQSMHLITMTISIGTNINNNSINSWGGPRQSMHSVFSEAQRVSHPESDRPVVTLQDSYR